LPKIMSIRAFDKDEKGSIYTVSCALSYAIQHKADYINASWGYFGAQDPVLRRYIKIADRASIRVIAAAGNSPVIHQTKNICDKNINDLNDLERLESKDSLFYPACFASTVDNVVSVTQVSPKAPNSFPNVVPCYYQNFSSRYITVGAFDKNLTNNVCCTFSIPFLSPSVEGSSFATPAATGFLMTNVTSKTQNIKKYITTHCNPTLVGATTGSVIYTNQGDIIEYTQK
jgi:Subtilase family